MITHYHIARGALQPKLSTPRNSLAIPTWMLALLLCIAASLIVGCDSEVSDKPGPAVKPRYVVTIAPVASLVTDLVRGRAEVTCLLRPGISEHAFELRPSDMRHVQGASALITVAPDIDAWADRLPIESRIQLISFIEEEDHIEGVCPDHGHEHHAHDEVDGHIWTDARLMRKVLPALVAELCRVDPEGAETYRANEVTVAAELDALDAEIAAMLAPAQGEVVFTYHAGLQYFLARYGLTFGGVIELLPGREPSPTHLATLVQSIKSAGARAIFTEPNLARQPAEILAREAGLPLFELDPIGGTPGRVTYREMMLYNARTLAEALAPRAQD